MKAKKFFEPEKIISEIDDLCNEEPDFINSWGLVNAIYEQCGFIDSITDEEKINERIYINGLFSKAIKEKRLEIMGKLDRPNECSLFLDKLLKTEINKPNDGWTRKFIVYIILYKRWLSSIKRRVDKLVRFDKEQKDKED